jgi:hypothetical protein
VAQRRGSSHRGGAVGIVHRGPLCRVRRRGDAQPRGLWSRGSGFSLDHHHAATASRRPSWRGWASCPCTSPAG